MRVKQLAGEKGSLKWIQLSVTAASAQVESSIRRALDVSPAVEFEWCSPRKVDDWAEYRDGEFLDVVGLTHLRPALERFWPRRGPQWDALARLSDGKVLLIEAKSHPREMLSSCRAGADSHERIAASLATVREQLGAPAEANWMSGYFQYANRLAHLTFLKNHDVDAHLLFVYFLNDKDMRGPSTVDEWHAAEDEAHEHLGINPHSLSAVHSIYVDVLGLAAATSRPA